MQQLYNTNDTHWKLGRTISGCPPKAGTALSISGCDLIKPRVWSDNSRELLEHACVYTTVLLYCWT